MYMYIYTNTTVLVYSHAPLLVFRFSTAQRLSTPTGSPSHIHTCTYAP